MTTSGASWLTGLISLSVVAVLMAWIALACKMPGLSRRHLGAGRLRTSSRLTAYRITRRMPGKCPRRDLYRLGDFDRGQFAGIVTALSEKGPLAAEPEYRRLP